MQARTQEQGKGHSVECRARDSVTLGIAGVRRDTSSLRAGLWLLGSGLRGAPIKGSGEQKPGLAEGSSPSALQTLSLGICQICLLFCSGHPWPVP